MRSTLGYLLLLSTLVRHCDPPRHRFLLKKLDRVDVAWPGGGEALYVTELEGTPERR
jgi:hypothetical protein